MAKVKINWPPMSMKAEGEDAAVLAQAEQFLKYVKEAHKISFDVLPTIFRDGCRDPEEGVGEPECVGCNDDCESCETYEKANSVKPLTEPEEVAPGAQWDVVAIYDNAGIPSIMHRFRRMNDKDLFRGGKDKPHPAFIIGGEVYDEIYISVYQNTMINGKPYSLPYMEPVTDITADKFADACFSKGEGWHCMTAAEWGLLACLSWKNGTLPHGNTRCGKYHADPTECGVNVKDSNKTLTGSGPATWTHDHTPTGVHDLCGNVGEIVRGLRIKDGALWAAENNNAALPETDLTTCGDGWKPIVDSNGDQVYVDAMDGIKFTTEKPQHVLVAALLHDYCKVSMYHDKGNGEYEYFDAGMVGHGEGSVIMAQQYIKLTAREIVAIRWHMGAYSGKQDWETLSAVYDRYPEVLCLHFADMIATHYDER